MTDSVSLAYFYPLEKLVIDHFGRNSSYSALIGHLKYLARRPGTEGEVPRSASSLWELAMTTILVLPLTALFVMLNRVLDNWRPQEHRI